MPRPRAAVVALLFGLLSFLATASQAMAQGLTFEPIAAPPAEEDAAGNPAFYPDFALGIGYANVSIGDGEFDSENALHFNPVISFSPIQKLGQLRLGAGVPFSMVINSSSRTIISSGGGLIVVGSGEIPLWLVEPEVSVSWRQPLGSDQRFYVEPGIAAGGTFAILDFGDDTSGSISESDITWSARAFLRFGVAVEGGHAGIEASYLRSGDLDLAQNVSGEAEEFYIGIFGSLAF